MKNNVSLITGALLIAAAAGSYAQTAVTDPVGYVTMPVAGGGSTASPSRSYIGATLVNKIEYSGVVTAVAGTTISFAAGSFTAGAFNADAANGNLYYAEIGSGANQGAWTDIVSNTTSSLVTSDNISSLVAVGDKVKLRKHHTVSSVFGATNSSGFAAGIDVSTADELQFLDASTQQATTVFFSTDDLNPGWVTVAGNPAANMIIPPGVGVKVSRKSAAALPIVQVGHVKTGPTWLPVESGINVITIPLATGTTFDLANLSPPATLAGGIDISAADEVGLLSSGAFVNNFFSTDDLNPGWVTAAGNAAGTTALPEGTAIRILRKGTGTATNWKAPLQPIAP